MILKVTVQFFFEQLMEYVPVIPLFGTVTQLKDTPIKLSLVNISPQSYMLHIS